MYYFSYEYLNLSEKSLLTSPCQREEFAVTLFDKEGRGDILWNLYL